jgi:hypothetical protein
VLLVEIELLDNIRDIEGVAVVVVPPVPLPDDAGV